MTNCKTCKAPVIFLPTSGGKMMPVDAETVSIYDEVFDSDKHTSHFVTCPDAKKFRKPTTKKGKK